MKTLRCLLALAALVLASATQAAVPTMIDFQGFVRDSSTGQPITGQHILTTCLFSDIMGDTAVWTESDTLTFDGGVFTTKLGDVQPLTISLFQDPTLFLEVAVDGTISGPRTQLVSVPFALFSQLADSAGFAINAAHAVYADSAGHGGSGGADHWASNGDHIYNTNNGNIGFGTTIPQYKYHFNGGNSVWPFYLEGSNALMALEGNGNIPQDIREFQVGNGGHGTEVSIIGKGYLGVGTTAPSARIDIQDTSTNTLCNLNSYLNYGSGITGNYIAHQLRARFGSGTGALTGLSIINDQFGSGPSYALTVMGGNVGIGTTNPIGKLHIDGAWPHIVVSNGASQYGIGVDNNVFFLKKEGDNTGQFRFRRTDFTDLLVVDIPTGNVGVGTITPQYPLEVSGIVSTTSGGFRFPDGTIQSSAAGSGLWAANGSSIYYNNGNVGIGTSAPDSKMQVLGSADGDNPLVRITNNGTGHGMLIQSGASGNSSLTSAFEADNFCAGATTATGILGVTYAQGKPKNPDGTGGGSAVGVYGISATSGATGGGAAFGVLGRAHNYKQPGSDSSVPAGVFGEATSLNGISWGMDAEVHGSDPSSAGLMAKAWNESGNANGALIVNNSHSGTGVRVLMPGNNDLGIYCQGRIEATGSLALLQESGSVMTRTYIPSSANNEVTYTGDGQLVNGHAHIELDPIYLGLVTIDQVHRLRVFVTYYTPPKVQPTIIRSATGFDIVDATGTNTEFSWEVKAVRKGFEDKRFEVVSSQ